MADTPTCVNGSARSLGRALWGCGCAHVPGMRGHHVPGPFSEPQGSRLHSEDLTAHGAQGPGHPARPQLAPCRAPACHALCASWTLTVWFTESPGQQQGFHWDSDSHIFSRNFSQKKRPV